MLNVLLVDDHPAVTEGTKLILERDREFCVTVQNDVSRLLDTVMGVHFEVMLFDLSMPPYNGIDLASSVLEHKPGSCILIYTGFDISPHLNRLIDHGLSGYISKTASRDQLLNAIRCALRGEIVLPLEVFRSMRREQGTAEPLSPPAAKPALQERDLLILSRIAEGHGNRQIADSMCMSQRSLEYHLTHLFQKLAVKSRIEAVSKAKDLGILKPEGLTD